MSSIKASDTSQRKAYHIRVALERDVEFHTRSAGFDRYILAHQALPGIDRGNIDTSTLFLHRRLSFPLIISSMTGGTEEAAELNRRFAQAAQILGLGMGVGSQRAALEEHELAYTYQVRDVAPDILLFANLGAVQLNYGCGPADCVRAVEMIGADALMLHLNPLQECIQPGGNTNFSDLVARIAEVCQSLAVPVVVKEVGHGISERTAKLLAEAGVAGIDVAGAGGTSWAKMESYRDGDPHLSPLGASLGEWGIPTVDSLLAVKSVAPHLPTIASGGVRTGQDIAKSITLGADAAAMALPLLKRAFESQEALQERLSEIRDELATVMFCAGCRNIEELSRAGLLEAAPKARA